MTLQTSTACIVLCLFLLGARTAQGPAIQQETLTVLKAGGDERRQYFLVPSAQKHTPTQKLGLILVLPGGDGSAAQNGRFVEMMASLGIPDGFLVADLVAPVWFPEQQIVWPISSVTEKGVGFVTHEFIDAVIDEVSRQYEIDAGRIYLIAWSSSGPATQEYLLSSGRARGAIIGASIFRPNVLPPLTGSKGKFFCLLHSREDPVVKLESSERGYEELTAAGGSVYLKVNNGKQHMDFAKPQFQPIRDCVHWLETGGMSKVESTPDARIH